MKIIKQSHEIIVPNSYRVSGHDCTHKFFIDGLKICEMAARTCYNSTDKITDYSYSKLLKKCNDSGHGSVLEHFQFSVKFITDRSVTHEFVRHRHCAYSQLSQRYVDYTKDRNGGQIEFIEPVDFDSWTPNQKTIWEHNCLRSEDDYISLIKEGLKPEKARSVLTNSAATILIVSASLREWGHIFRLRTAPDAHPQIRALITGLKKEINGYCDIYN